MQPTKPDEKSIAVYYDTVTKAHAAQFDRAKQLDTKLAAVFGLSSVALPAVGVLLANAQRVPLPSVCFLALALVAYGVMVWQFWRAYKARHDMDGPPDLESLQDYAQQAPEKDLKHWIADVTVQAYRKNRPLEVEKGDRLNLALLSFVGLVACLTAALLCALVWPYLSFWSEMNAILGPR